MKSKSLLVASTLAGMVLVAGSANAAQVVFTFHDTVSAATTSGISAGDAFTVHLYADNGGASLVNQVWNLADLQGFTIDAGTYHATYSTVWLYPSTNNFTTDAGGAVSHVEFYGTADSSSNVDNFGSWLGDTVFGDAEFVDSNGHSNSIAAGSFNNASKWTVALAGAGGVPEPATWMMMIAGFAGLGVVARRRRATALA